MGSLFELRNILICALIGIIIYQYIAQPHKNPFVKRRKQEFTSKVASSISLESSEINDKLNEHTKLFEKKEIIKVNEKVYVGIGYGLANTIVIEADNSYIVVDTLESIDGAREFRNDFNKLYNNSQKGISTIVFTHYHADHTQGTEGFIDDLNDPPIIISHELTEDGLHRVNSIQSSIVFTRAMRQFGTYTKQYDVEKSNNGSLNLGNKRLHVNSGIGPELKVGDSWSKSILLPSKVVNKPFTRMEVDGIILDIYYAPGETDDQIFLYLPELRTLLPADNIYETFPNLYAIRGSPTRDARKWVKSLDTMRFLHKNVLNYDMQNQSANGGPMYMVPCHTRPVTGFENIEELLTLYRDGIQYIHDQTLRFMNKGLTASEMLPIIKDNMPDRLRNHPWLQEFYGTIDWSIRGIFNQYLGWFSGDASDLFPLSKSKIAQNLILTLEMFANMIENDKIEIETSEDAESESDLDPDSNSKYIINFMLNMANIRINEHTTKDDCQWSLDIATNLLHLKDDIDLGAELRSNNINDEIHGIFIKLSKKQYEHAKQVRISALTCMAGYQISANGRNYYLTSALEDSGNFRIKPTKKAIDSTVINDINLDYLFDTISVRYKYENAVQKNAFVNTSVCFLFDITNDTKELNSFTHASKFKENEIEDITLNNKKTLRETELREIENKKKELKNLYSWYEVIYRDGIMEIWKGSDLMKIENSKFGWLLKKDECITNAELVLEMKSMVYKELAASTRRSGAALYTQGEINVKKGSLLTVNKMNAMFDKE